MTVSISEVEVWSLSWASLVLRGVAALAFGALSIVAPSISFAALVLAFGAYAFVDGILALGIALKRTEDGRRRWPLLLEGVVGLGTGIVTALLPAVASLALLYVVASWAIITGVLAIVAAVRLRKLIHGELLLGLSGVVSIALGLGIGLFPAPGALALAVWLGAYALLFGVLLIALGLRARSWQRHQGEPLGQS